MPNGYFAYRAPHVSRRIAALIAQLDFVLTMFLSTTALCSAAESVR
jgi:hypothetical protein